MIAINVLEPWVAVTGDRERQALELQLQQEAPPDHVLAGTHPHAVARRQDRDDVLFALGSERWAVVHLTWQGSQTDANWPRTTILEGRGQLQALIERDAADFA